MPNQNEALRSMLMRRAQRFSPGLYTILRNKWSMIEPTTLYGKVKLRTSGLVKIAATMKTDLKREGFPEMANRLFPDIPSNPPREDSPPVPDAQKPAVQPASRKLTLPTDPTVLERYREHLVNRSVRLHSLLKIFEGQEIAPTKDGVPIPLNNLRGMALTAFQDMKAAGLEQEAKTIFEAQSRPESQ